MQVKISQLLESKTALRNLYGQKLGGALAFKIYGIVKAVEVELDKFEEVRKKTLQDSGATLDEKDNMYKFSTKEIEKKVNQEFADIVNTEVTVHSRCLTMEDVENIPEISGQDVHVLNWMIENGDSNK